MGMWEVMQVFCMASFLPKLILTKKKPWSPGLISLHCALHKEYVMIKYFYRTEYEVL